MEKFTKEEKELLAKNPNIQAVLSDKVLYNYKKPFSFFAETNAKDDYTEIEADKMYENFELEKFAM